MSVDAQQQCLRCGAFVPLPDLVCAHCGTSLLVEVTLLSPAPDARGRFELMKALGALDALHVDLAAEFKRKTPTLARGVSRAVAVRVGQALASKGLEFEVMPVGLSTSQPGGGRGRRVGLAVGLAVIVAVAGAAVVRHRRGGPPAAPEQTAAPSATVPPAGAPTAVTRRSLKEVVNSVASIRCARSVGTGFFVAPHHLVTNSHVLCDAPEQATVVLASGAKSTSRIVRRDPQRDLALLEVDIDAPTLEVGDATQVEVGSAVAMVGSPKGLDFTVNRGTLSYVGRVKDGVAYLQMDIAVNPGNSGGPVLDENGTVIGVVTAMLKDADAIGLALPINYLLTGRQPVWPEAPSLLLSPEWDNLLATAKQTEEATDASTRTTTRQVTQVGLAMAQWVSPRQVEAVVVSPLENGGNRRWAFRLMRADQLLCDLSPVRQPDWFRLDSNNPNINPEVGQRLRASNLDQKLFVGVMVLEWSECHAVYALPSRYDLALELEGADDDFRRVGIKLR